MKMKKDSIDMRRGFRDKKHRAIDMHTPCMHGVHNCAGGRRAASEGMWMTIHPERPFKCGSSGIAARNNNITNVIPKWYAHTIYYSIFYILNII